MSDSDAIAQLTAFVVGEEEYVVDIQRVREIIRPVPVTQVRRGPRYVEGVINLRGTVIPVVDMRRRFGLPTEKSSHQKIIILAVQDRTVGIVVDRVTEVVRVPRSSIQPAPGIFENRAPFFLGVCEHQGRELILLNVKNVVGSDDEIDPPSAQALLAPEESG